VFDLGWSKLIIIAMLAIVVVGPKDLPALLRTIGKFVGQIRRQADEFRRQFDEAMKDTELDQIRKDVEDIKRTATESVRDIERSAEDSVKPLETAASEITHLGNGTTPDAAIPAEIATELPPGVNDLPQLPATPALPASAPGSLTKAGA
jgi:sec-independent protein translocase protein TatB